MSNIDNPVPDAGSAKGAVETKTKAASLAAFVVSTVALSWISSVDTDMIKSLPDWLETLAYAALASGVVYLTAFNTKHKPGKLSLSALRAAARSRNL
jgi:hypothetical protein